MFNTLKNNSGDYYYLISDNLISISEELSKKNEVIDQYLDKSKQSYFLAIIALCLTILQTLPVLWKEVRNWLPDKKKDFANRYDNTHDPG